MFLFWKCSRGKGSAFPQNQSAIFFSLLRQPPVVGVFSSVLVKLENCCSAGSSLACSLGLVPSGFYLHPGIGLGCKLEMWAPGSWKVLMPLRGRNSLQGLRPAAPDPPHCSFPGPGISSGFQPWAAVCGVWFLPTGEGNLW